jgi:hypothetical protein
MQDSTSREATSMKDTWKDPQASSELSNPVHTRITFKGTKVDFARAVELVSQEKGAAPAVRNCRFTAPNDGAMEVSLDTGETIEVSLAKALSTLTPYDEVVFTYHESYPVRRGTFVFVGGQLIECEYSVGRMTHAWSIDTRVLRSSLTRWDNPSFGHFSGRTELWTDCHNDRDLLIDGCDEPGFVSGRDPDRIATFNCDPVNSGDDWWPLIDVADVHARRYPDEVVPGGGFLTTLVGVQAPVMCRPEALVDCPITLVPRVEGATWDYCVLLGDADRVDPGDDRLIGQLCSPLSEVVLEFWPAVHTGVIVGQEFDARLGWIVRVYLHPCSGASPEMQFPSGLRERLEDMVDPRYCSPLWEPLQVQPTPRTHSIGRRLSGGTPHAAVGGSRTLRQLRSGSPAGQRRGTALIRTGYALQDYEAARAAQSAYGDEPLVHLLGTVEGNAPLLYLSFTGLWNFADAYDAMFEFRYSLALPAGIDWIVLFPPNHDAMPGAYHAGGAIWLENLGGPEASAVFPDKWYTGDTTEESFRMTATVTANEFYEHGLETLIPGLGSRNK